jgi:osmotically-inducible protein OsmY
MKTSEKIKKDIIDHLCWDVRVDSSAIEVKVLDDRVILEGDVPSYTMCLFAFEDARSVADDRRIVNTLNVKSTREGSAGGDVHIQDSIKYLFKWNSRVEKTDINVIVKDGFVTLEGNVDSYYRKFQAERLAGEVLGVKGINNLLIILPAHRTSDEIIAHDIEKALVRRRYGTDNSINIIVENGIVTLEGEVNDWDARDSIEVIVFHTYGVKDVNNKLHIKPYV